MFATSNDFRIKMWPSIKYIDLGGLIPEAYWIYNLFLINRIPIWATLGLEKCHVPFNIHRKEKLPLSAYAPRGPD